MSFVPLFAGPTPKGGAFVPADLTNLLFDFDPENRAYSDTGATTRQTTVGGTVRAVKYGSVIASTASTSYTLVDDEFGRQAILAPSVNAGFAATGINIPSTRNCSIHIVFRAGQGAGSLGLFDFGDANGYWVVRDAGKAFNVDPSIKPNTPLLAPETCVLGVLSSGSGVTIRKDGAQIGSSASLMIAPGAADINFLNSPGLPTWPANGRYHRIIVCAPCLSGADLTNLENYLIGRYPPRTIASSVKAVVCQGNSLTYGTGAAVGSDYVTQLQTLLGATYDARNRGVSGATTTNLNTHAPYDVDTYYNGARPKNYAVLWELTNAILGGSSAATAFADVKTWADARQTAGFTTILLDCLPRSNFSGGQETIRTTVNASLSGDYTVATADPLVWLPGAGGTYADALVKVSGIAQLANTGDGTYYTDGTHLTAAGYALIAAKVAVALPLV